jgi:hypothetical protein
MSPAVPIVLFALAVQGAAPAASINDAAWFAGCWEFTSGSRTVRETWTPPAGGTMLATSRTVTGAKTTEYEFVILREAAGGLEYVAKPSGQSEAVFTSTRILPDELVFENPRHDFPTKIVYQKQGDDGLLAIVSGTIRNETRSVEFRYRAVPCGR